mmetsp:Transcript_22815/g.26190  ORF Transcript_22815/g.26190 Transcript_22815/m.26190 type:complete len:86 (+) Transcript_22815:5-262(+)
MLDTFEERDAKNSFLQNQQKIYEKLRSRRSSGLANNNFAKFHIMLKHLNKKDEEVHKQQKSIHDYLNKGQSYSDQSRSVCFPNWN